MNSIKIAACLLFFFSPVIFSCEKENLKLKSDKAELDFPDCKLIREELQTSYGMSQKKIYHYEHGKLIKKDFYYGEIYNSSKYFTYDEQGNVQFRLNYNSYDQKMDTIGSYDFENNLLTAYTHYKTSDQSIRSKMEFEYENAKLKFVTTTNEEGHFRFMVETDNVGNPIRHDLIEQNHSTPSRKMYAIFEYDDKFNPFYKIPGPVEMEYFSPNNLVKVRTFLDEVEQKNNSGKVLEYHDNNLLRMSTDEFSQGFHVITYEYECE